MNALAAQLDLMCWLCTDAAGFCSLPVVYWNSQIEKERIYPLLNLS